MTTNSLRSLLRPGTTRRNFLQAAASVGLVPMMLPLAGRRASAAEGEATYFTWGGYDIPELQTKYTEKYGAVPQFVTYGDDEEGFQKMRAGFLADVIHPCSSDIPRWKDSGIIQAIDTSRIPNYANLFEPLKALPAANIDGKVWFVPWEYGFTSITYRTDLVKLPNGEETWGILWDEANKGKISIIDSAEDSWWVAAIYAGLDLSKIDEAAIQKVNELLKQQRPMVRMYSSDKTAQEQALASGEVVAAMTWADTPTSLLKQGVPVKFAQPKEGAFTWVCGLVLHAQAPHLDKAYDLINGMLDPEIGKYCIENFGYGHSNPKSFEGVDPAQLAAIGMEKGPMETLASGIFALPQPEEITTRIARDWEQIKSGF